METMDYEKQGTDFLEKTETKFVAEFVEFGKYFPSDKENRDIYKITLSRNGREYSFRFGQSIADSQGYYDRVTKKRITEETAIMYGLGTLHKKKGKIPTAYAVLSCVEKVDAGTFEDFCFEFGYDTDSITAKNTYEAVRDEHLNLARLFNNAELEQMAEIQ